MHLDVTLGQIMLGGCVAGLTIYLGLPIALFSVNRNVRTFLNALAVGILLFLFVEIAYQGVERVESYLKLSSIGYATVKDLYEMIAIFIAGFTAALLGLVWFEKRWIHTSPEVPHSSGMVAPRQLALMIAIGIGLHNFGEGLIIGQSLAGGHYSLGILLVVGFALHNGSEGFGIAAPLAGEKPSLGLLLLLGLIGGGPTIVGTYLGTFWLNEYIEMFFLALAAGSILYIIGELIHLGRLRGGHLMMTTGLLLGFFVAFASDLFIAYAVNRGLDQRAGQKTVSIEAGEYYFKPNVFEVEAGQPVKLMITNRGEAEHEFEIFAKGFIFEQVLPVGKTTPVYLDLRYPGKVPFICDMPGHLGGGMYGHINVKTPGA